MTIEELNVMGCTLDAARLLQAACPWIVFTSGRRDWYAQAHAMAMNTVARWEDHGDKLWVKQVYPTHPTLDQVVQNMPETDWQNESNVYTLADRLYQAFAVMPMEEKDRFAHPAGRAFDLAPVTDPATREQTEAAIYALPKVQKFLTSEGGLVIWHVQFVQPTAEVV